MLTSWVVKAMNGIGYTVHRSDAARRVAAMTDKAVDLVIDVGAAEGLYGAELRKAGYRGRILSFEPLDVAYAHLARRSASDPKWEAVKLALGDSIQTAEIHIAANSDSSSLLPMLDRHVAAAPHAAFVGTQKVDVSTLDASAGLLGTAQRPFLKIDTQGFERAVLDGAVDTIGRLVGLQLELSFTPLYDGGMLADEALARVRDLGFTLMNLEPGFRDPATGQLLQSDGVFFREA